LPITIIHTAQVKVNVRLLKTEVVHGVIDKTRRIRKILSVKIPKILVPITEINNLKMA
jgi:hypothetical protein